MLCSLVQQRPHLHMQTHTHACVYTRRHLECQGKMVGQPYYLGSPVIAAGSVTLMCKRDQVHEDWQPPP